MEAGPGDGVYTDVGRQSVTLDRLGQKWTGELLNAHRSRLTAKQYLYALDYFSRWLDSLSIHFLSVTRADVQQWLTEERMAGHEPVTIRNRFGVVRAFYSWLTALDYITKDPCLSIIQIKVPRKIPETMTVKEVDRMAKACETCRELAIVETLYSTAARRAGLLGIRLQDLDFERGQVKITGKGGKELYCYLSPRAIRAIKRWITVRAQYPCLTRKPTDRLFISRKGPLGPTQLTGIIHAIRSRAGLNKRVTPHTWRHSAATHYRDQGATIEDIADVLGHANIQNTLIYAKTSTAKIRRTWERLPR